MTAREVDAAINTVAKGQFGAFNHTQALQAGATEHIIGARLRSGAWGHLDRAVYAVAGSPETWERRLMASWLGEDALAGIALASAATLHGYYGFAPGRPELTVVHHGNHRSGLAVVHESRLLTSADIVDVGGIPTTTPEFTILQLARRLGPKRLADVIDDAAAAHTLSLLRLHERFETYAGRGQTGTRKLRAILDVRRPGYVPPASVLEREFFEVLERGGLPAPTRQFELPWRTIRPGRSDSAFVPQRLLCEVDSRRWHTRMKDFAIDRQRDRDAVEHGWAVIRFVAEEIRGDPNEVIRSVRACLRAAA
jgi:hypothetical protein